MRQLILKIVNGETAGEYIACALPAAMFTRRRQGEAMVINGTRRVEAVSTVVIRGSTPMRQLIVEIVTSETPESAWLGRCRRRYVCNDGKMWQGETLSITALRYCPL